MKCWCYINLNNLQRVKWKFEYWKIIAKDAITLLGRLGWQKGSCFWALNGLSFCVYVFFIEF